MNHSKIYTFFPFPRAFVGSEQIETYWAIKTGTLVERSPQELLSCSPSLGCEGGNTCVAMQWLVKVCETCFSIHYEVFSFRHNHIASSSWIANLLKSKHKLYLKAKNRKKNNLCRQNHFSELEYCVCFLLILLWKYFG